MEWLIILAIIVVFLIYKFGTRKSTEPPLLRTGLPIVGPAIEFTKDPVQLLSWGKQKYGDVFTLDLLARKMTFVGGEENHKRFFKSPESLVSFQDAIDGLLKPALGFEFYKTYGAHWNTVVTEAIKVGLHPVNFPVYSRTVQRRTVKFLDQWYKKNGSSLDLVRLGEQMVTEIEMEGLFGTTIYERIGLEIAGNITEFETALASKEINFLPSFLAKKQLDILARTRTYISQMVKDNWETIFSDDNCYLGKWYKEFERQIEAHKEITFDVIQAYVPIHATLLAMAARTNTVYMFVWILAHLLRSPSALEETLQELKQLNRNQEGVFDSDVMRKLPYLEAVLKEGLRMHPPIMLMRVTREPIELEKYVLPAGRTVIISAQRHQTDPAVFPDPDQFKPERFLNKDTYNLSYFPWGHGAHKCLGMSFASSVIKSAMCQFLLNYEVQLEDPVRPLPLPDYSKISGTVPPLGEIRIRMVPK